MSTSSPATHLELSNLVDPNVQALLIGDNHLHLEAIEHITTQWEKLRELGFDTLGAEGPESPLVRMTFGHAKAFARMSPEIAVNYLADSLKGKDISPMFEKLRPGITRAYAANYVGAMMAGFEIAFLDNLDGDLFGTETRNNSISNKTISLVEAGRKPVVMVGASHLFDLRNEPPGIAARLENQVAIQQIILAGEVMSRLHGNEDGFPATALALALGRERQWFAVKPDDKRIYFHVPNQENLTLRDIAERIVAYTKCEAELLAQHGLQTKTPNVNAFYWEARLSRQIQNPPEFPPYKEITFPLDHRRDGIGLDLRTIPGQGSGTAKQMRYEPACL